MDSSIQVLAVEDSHQFKRWIQEALLNGRVPPENAAFASSLGEALKLLAERRFDVVLLDLGLPDSMGVETFDAVRQAAPDLAIVVLTSMSDMTTARLLLERGAQDYLIKGDIGPSGLARSLQYAVERHQYRSALQANETTLRHIIDNHVDAILLVDESGCIRFVNAAAERFFARPSAELLEESLGMPVLEGTTTRVDLTAQDGTHHVAEMRAVPIVLSDRRMRMVTLRDVRDAAHVEEERLRMQRLEMLGFLAGGIAHDFNNFLTGLGLNLHLLRHHATSAEERANLLDQFQGALERARDLTRQLLAFSRGETFTADTASVADIVRESAGFALRGSAVECEMRMPEDLWGVHLDPGRLSQVVGNIVLNAVQAMPDGGHVRLSGENTESGHGRFVRITISDDGPGIDEEHRLHVFRPYFTTKSTGTGLGLSTCYQIVKTVGGSIDMESHVGQGTTFHILLPAAERVSTQVCEDSVPEGGRGRVLLMDDDEDVRRSLAGVLSRLGYEVMVARDGGEAVTCVEQAHRRFDAVLLDLTVPGGIGAHRAVKRIREIDPDVRAIACSAYPSEEVALDPASHGFVAFLRKPYTVEELCSVLRGACLGVTA